MEVKCYFPDPVLNSMFASAERASPEELTGQHKLLTGDETLVKIVESVSEMILILNMNRQIVYANRPFLENAGVPDLSSVIGQRPGEVLKCSHASIETGGCGTSKYCRFCGAVNSILNSFGGYKTSAECQILKSDNTALDLTVTSNPIYVSNELFIIFSIADISAEKWKQSVEKVFIHDIINRAGVIYGFSSLLLRRGASGDETAIYNTLQKVAKNLLDDIHAQKDFILAEKGELKPNFSLVNSTSLLTELYDVYSLIRHDKDRELAVSDSSPGIAFRTDPVLLNRILGNMIINAFEGSGTGETVTISCSYSDNKIRFSVHNKACMREDVQLQVFKRTYSTKGEGRGFGTYSMKVLGEKILGGNVWFTSTPESGTIFNIELDIS